MLPPQKQRFWRMRIQVDKSYDKIDIVGEKVLPCKTQL